MMSQPTPRTGKVHHGDEGGLASRTIKFGRSAAASLMSGRACALTTDCHRRASHPW